MAMRDDFCAFILTHGRPDRVHTYKTLMRAGYTGKVYLVIDNEDKTADQYRETCGDKVLMFDKAEIAKRLDDGDNSGSLKSTLYVRAALFDLAKQVGCRYFVQLDDDYTSFQLRAKSNGEGCYILIAKTLDDYFSSVLDFLNSSDQICTVALAQGGDFLGGGNIKGGLLRLRRKAMNSFFCDTEKHWTCLGRMNEDVSAYVTEGRKGRLFFTTMQAMLVQMQTQANAGGMSDLYVSNGTYVKSFYTVMYAPSCTKIGVMGDHRSSHYRIHHKINWHNTAPKILREEWKKGVK